MPGPEAWQAFGGVGAVLIFLGAIVLGLKRLGIIGQPAANASAAPFGDRSADPDLIERIHKLEREFDGFKLCAAETYVRREDYVVAESRVIGILDRHGTILTRLEERIDMEFRK